MLALTNSLFLFCILIFKIRLGLGVLICDAFFSVVSFGFSFYFPFSYFYSLTLFVLAG